MIEVNLLPQELRPVDKTPLPRLLAILSAVFIAGVEVVLLIILFLRWIPDEKVSLDSTKLRIQNLNADLEEYYTLKQEILRKSKRVETIVGLYESRFVWARLLDRLRDPQVLPDRVWINKLEFEPPRRTAKEVKPGDMLPGGTLVLECFARPETFDTSKEIAAAQMLKVMGQFMAKIENDAGPPGPDVLGLKDMLLTPVKMKKFDVEETPVAGRRGKDDEVPRDLPSKVLRFRLEIVFRPKKAPQPTR